MIKDEQESAKTGGHQNRSETSSGANTPEAGTPKKKTEEVTNSDASTSRTNAGSSDR